jgi:Zn-dependent metalloprotease
MGKVTFGGFQIQGIDNDKLKLDEHSQPTGITVHLNLEPVDKSIKDLEDMDIKVCNIWYEAYTQIQRNLADKTGLRVLSLDRSCNSIMIQDGSVNTIIDKIEQYHQVFIDSIDTINKKTQRIIDEKVAQIERREEAEKEFIGRIEQINSKCFPGVPTVQGSK